MQDSVTILNVASIIEHHARVAPDKEAIVWNDVRLSFGQLNALPNSDDPAVLGNELSARHRFRLRARLAVRGQIGKDVFLGTYDREGKKQSGKEFEWGLRLATGNFPDIISSNQTFTDFFSRKSFALDQAYVTYRPAPLPGLQLQGGKFDVPWLRTEMTIDNDLTVEGFNESYTRGFKKSALKTLTFVAWQLPFLERNSAFVVGADGRVNLEQTGRAGRDLALYGAQLRARFEPTKNTALTLAAADLFYSGTQFITPAQVFGGNLQVPVTVTIPATATAPPQTVAGFVPIAANQLFSSTPTSASPSPRTRPNPSDALSSASTRDSTASTTRAASAGPSCCSSTSSKTRRRTTWCWPGGRAARTASCPTTRTPDSGPSFRWAARSSAASTCSATRSRASRRTPC